MTLWQDILFAVRTLWTRRGFALIAILSLALGIGANTTIFSIINGTLIGALPFAQPERLAFLWSIPVNNPESRGSVTGQNYVAWKEQAKSFSAIGAIYGVSGNVGSTENGTPAEQIDVMQFSASMWDVWGVKPLLGRVFSDGENVPANPAPVAVLSYDYWQRVFGGKPDAIGKTIPLDGQKIMVIGVMPQGFRFRDDQEALYVPAEFSVQQMNSAAAYLLVAGRLKDGVSMAQAQGEMASIGKGLREAFPERNKDRTIRVEPLGEALYSGLEQPLFVLQSAVVFVLLIACANIAGLLMARASARTTEVAIRGALGAGRGRLIRQMLTESVVLALLGGVVGVGIGWVGLRLILASLGPGQLPASIGLDYRVFAFTAAVSVVTGLLFGLVPALQTTKVDLVTSLKETGRTGMDAGHKQKVRSLMVMAQISLALVLLTGAGLMMKSFHQLQTNPLGFDPRNVLAFEFRFGQNQLMHPVGRYRNFGLWEIHANAGQTFQRVFEKIQAIPGVTAAAAISQMPGAGNWMTMLFRIPGQPAPDPNTPGGSRTSAAYFAVTPGYFQTMRIPVMGGREFNDRDTETGAPVIVINKAFADRWFPGQNPIGQRIALDFVPDEPVREVVGMVGNTLPNLYQKTAEPTMFVPHLQQSKNWQGPSWGYRASMAFLMRTNGDPNALIPAVRAAVGDIDPAKPATNLRTIEAAMQAQIGPDRLFMLLLVIFGGAAAILAAIGIYGVTAYAVAQRTREIGVRMALGADATRVVRLVIRQALLLVAVGVLVGLGGAWALTRFLANYLWNVSPTDPLTFVAVTAGLIVVSLLACLVPTLRAVRVDPAIALRYE